MKSAAWRPAVAKAGPAERIEAAIARQQAVCRHEHIIASGRHAGRCWWCGAHWDGRVNGGPSIEDAKIIGRTGGLMASAERRRRLAR